ncbi:D-alanyl-D-alanine carboxypeptidase/D-alanyl-D-alanine-endopeptidase (penicillin-binding protein 4) [Kineosphaera limosa]|uniref:Putative peptidase S13 family protein n=1 Tax=Kineosphaera limosa NBRC 100340 TaxID=1184609 RepID=K6VLL9_9MICO|nr:D-alanyl-D-alanine carboxypeptidase/D-alanyl-D-alanine-endopeptidase [Kineosphaera limosa]NYE00320.1 D-alanyl-D-alanine carboxypeptidase/D-alanyl-D-alanine-endopeptidase (penicillin-binding protein 4) [Kineosphaera limosa]GAB97118.1 putative peptidase S13 family protein [Kineosphaera limosa NBRC 100340]
MTARPSRPAHPNSSRGRPTAQLRRRAVAVTVGALLALPVGGLAQAPAGAAPLSTAAGASVAAGATGTTVSANHAQLAQVGVAAASADPVRLSTALQATIARQLAGGARSQYLAGLSGYVVDTATGEVVWSRSPDRTRMPASTQKVITAFVTLRSLHPQAQIITKTVQSQANPGNVYVVGGGDPTLTRARINALAAQTAAALQAQGRTSVNLYLDDTVFPRPTLATGWKSSYLRGDVQQVRGLTLRSYRGADGTLAAGAAFRSELTKRGVAVGNYGRGTAPGSDELARTASASITAIMSVMLNNSDNDYAEYLLRLSALRAGEAPTWNGSLRHARSVLAANGIPLTGYAAYDGSGLSRSNRMPVRTLVQTLTAMYQDPQDRALVFRRGALPISGQTGTLRTRYHSSVQRCAVGKVNAKTGTLGDVVALAGVAHGADGRDRIFAFLENGNRRTAAVRNAVDTLATSTVGCR